MQLNRDGAQLFRSVFALAEVAPLARLFDNADLGRPGTRLSASSELALHVAPLTSLARRLIGPAAQPVRATLFDKSASRNWSLGWHQDRTIAVRKRLDTPGFSCWTLKSGIQHVVPPIALLERMLTVRIHLDPVDPANAPLLISPGTHQLGRVAENEMARTVAQHGVAECLAEAGDVWAYATLILHASAAATNPRSRRVLQLLYSAQDLPGGLQWLGV